MRYIKEFFDKVLWNVNYGVMEFFNGVSFIGFGVAVYLTQSAMRVVENAIPSGPTPQTTMTICTIMILFGALKIWALVWGSIRLRKWIAFIAMFSWGFLLVVFTTPPYKPTAIFFILELTLFTLWIFIRLVLKHRAERLLDPRDPYSND